MKDDTTIKLSDINNADFTDGTEPRDDHLIELLGPAFKGEILCTMAMAEMDAVKPFSDFKPEISNAYRKHFSEKAQNDVPPSLLVYAKDGKLIMSDDYSSYAMYQEMGFHRAVCQVIGDTPEIEGVEYHGLPFVMAPLSAEVLEDE